MESELFKAVIEELQEMRATAVDNPYISPERKFKYFNKFTVAIEALFDLWFDAIDQPETEAKE